MSDDEMEEQIDSIVVGEIDSSPGRRIVLELNNRGGGSFVIRQLRRVAENGDGGEWAPVGGFGFVPIAKIAEFRAVLEIAFTKIEIASR
jgi:hypothetical protein